MGRRLMQGTPCRLCGRMLKLVSKGRCSACQKWAYRLEKRGVTVPETRDIKVRANCMAPEDLPILHRGPIHAGDRYQGLGGFVWDRVGDSIQLYHVDEREDVESAITTHTEREIRVHQIDRANECGRLIAPAMEAKR